MKLLCIALILLAIGDCTFQITMSRKADAAKESDSKAASKVKSGKWVKVREPVMIEGSIDDGYEWIEDK